MPKSTIRVCHVTSVHQATDVRIFWKECLSLSKQYDVSLIAPNTKDRDDQGIHIYGVELPTGRFSRQRCLNRVLEKMAEVDAEVYHFHDPELMRLGVKMKNRGKKVIFDSHEDVPSQILCKEYLPKITKKPISLLYSLYEKNLLKRYDALISVTPSIVERLEKINANTFMVTNYPVLTEYVPTREMKGGDKICFAGGVAVQYLHENVIRALSKTSATYLLAGQSYPGYLDELKKLEGWNKVDYLGVVSHDKVYDIYGQSTAGVVLLDYTANVGYHRGTLGVLKLFEYMMAGIPVIATDFDLWKEIVDGYNCGVCVNPHDIDAIADAINYFVEHPDIAKMKGLNGRKAVVQEFNWATQEKILFEMYDKVLKS